MTRLLLISLLLPLPAATIAADAADAPLNGTTAIGSATPAVARPADPFAIDRERMVDYTMANPIDGRPAIRDPLVLKAMRRVQRHLFVPEALRGRAYGDGPLPIGWDQTISQPYIVAFMTELLELGPGERVLEIGTGSGYQAAVLAEIAGATNVYSIEIVEPLAEFGRKNLIAAGYGGVVTKVGDGYQGWSDHAPFQAVIVTAAPDHVPQPLIDQLAPGGRLVIPVGRGHQELLLIRKTTDGVETRRSIPVRFVPMTGEAEEGAR